MEEKERLARIGRLRDELARENETLLRFQRAASQSQANVIAISAKIDELENKRWEDKTEAKTEAPPF